MAQKRMFSRTVTESDAFLDLPLSTQCLYFHVCLSADDDGFIPAGKRIARSIGASENDLETLVQSGFLIPFPESGVFVAAHFMVNNTLKADRYNPTVYQREKKLIELTENKVYQFRNQNGTGTEPERNHSGAEDRLGYSSEAEGIVFEESKSEESKDNSTTGKGSPGGEDIKDDPFNRNLLLTMGDRAGIKPDVEKGMFEYGFAAAYAAFTAWKKDGGIIGKYAEYLKGGNN